MTDTQPKITDIKQLPLYEKIVSGEMAREWIEVGLTEGPRVELDDVLKFFKFLEFDVDVVTWASSAIMAGRAARLAKGNVDLSEFHNGDIPDEWMETKLEAAKGKGEPFPTVNYEEAFLCQHNADWLADCLCYEGTGIDLSEVKLYEPLVRGSGWGFYIAEAKTVILSPRVAPELDNEGNLHNTEGPVIYDKIYALHGLVLPKEQEWIVKERDTLTRKKIDEIDNAEIRRVTIASYPEKYIQGDPVQSDDYGDLYLVTDSDDSSFNFGVVRVKNAADEKIYWLRVDPSVKTAHEAVASTFGMTPEEYQPQIQT